MRDAQKLINELNNDPNTIGYSGKSRSEILELLTAETVDSIRPLSSLELITWAGGGVNPPMFFTTRAERIHDAAEPDATPGIRGIAIIANRLLAREDAGLDLNEPAHKSMVDALVNGGVITVDDRTELYAMAAIKISRSDELNLGRIQYNHLQQLGISEPFVPTPTT